MKHVLEAMDLPPLETADDIQICLSNLFHAVAARRLGLHDVDRLLAVLRLASRNVRLKMQAALESQQLEEFEDEEETIPADCLYDEQPRTIVELLGAPPMMDHLLHQLTTEDCAGRHAIRKEVFDYIRDRLAAKKPMSAQTSTLSDERRASNQERHSSSVSPR